MVYAGVVLVLAVLVPLNIALVGYQVVSSLNPDYGVIQSHWYDRLIPSRFKSSQSLCDAHSYAISDTFVTNQTVFNWNIASLRNTSTSVTGYSGVSYAGVTLDDCDVSYVGVDANLMTQAATLSATVSCEGDSFPVYASTRFVASQLASTTTQLDTSLRNLIKDNNALVVAAILNAVGTILLTDMEILAIGLNETGIPIIISAESSLTPCPRPLMMSGLMSGCDVSSVYEPPILNITYVAMGLPTYYLLTGDELTRPAKFFNSSVNNALQTLHAAVRFDFGNALPNNLFTNTTAVVSANQTILPTFPTEAYDANRNKTVSYQESTFYDTLMGTYRDANGNKAFPTLPLDGSKRSTILVPFLCRFIEMRSSGNAFISVLVATLSMFSAGWAVFILICGHFAKRGQPQANQCEAHDAPSGLQYQHLQMSSLEAGMSPTTSGSAQKLAY
ncbi:hypothetical protein FRB95_001672 [Tulasnella sp. JGI-2019a]|nr:hypothetical protein FRB95_001672 [Tulasnella sp. JGI-2019a]